MCSRKSLNDKPARLAMMMFGGSPTRVAAPPMLEAKTSAIRNGTGLMSRRSQTSSVTGAISRTVVTLSRNAEATAVMRTSRTITRSGRAAGAFGGPDRQVLEDTGLAQHADDHHHAQQQEDDIPVDPGVVGVERVLGADNADDHHDGGTAERGLHLGHPLGGDQGVGDDEDQHRDRGHREPPAVGDAVTSPGARPPEVATR